MNYEENILIIRQPGNKDKFVGALKSSFDEECTRSIIATGDTEKECYENCIKNIINTLNRHLELYEKLGDVLQQNDYFLPDELIIEQITINEPMIDKNGYILMDGYDSLTYYEDTQEWISLYR